jgi:putative membrane-bound dehydrogenase-like protein
MRRFMLRYLAAALSVLFLGDLFLAKVAAAQDVIPHHQDKPPGPALTPGQAIAAMTVPEGFSVELVASEPEIVNPVAMTFDERGRIWITESLEYPRKAPGPGKDRVKVLEDTDSDGKADKFSVFAEGLNIPSGIAVGHGGVWVANSPDILFYPDADRDAQPDGPPQVVVTGFGRSDTHELPNSLTWGPDGYLYGLNGVFNHSHVKYAKENPNYKEDHPGWQFTCACFRIHPVTREFEIFCEGTSNPWGLAFDHEGSAFVSACVIDHLWHLVRTGYYHRQGGPYPPFTWKIDSIVKHTHQKAAYAGLCYFDSDAYPEQYRNKLYMGNIHGNCINVDKLQRDGSTYFATGEPDFLTANDAWFMPVSQKTGPDGCLYILDWYDRYHCYQDANRDSAGIDRLKGRLYRVRYKETPRAGKFDLAGESDEELFARLVSANGFYRDIALRVLLERRAARKFAADDDIVGRATKLIDDDDAPIRTRIHAASIATALAPGDSMSGLLSRMLDSSLEAWALHLIANRGPSDLLSEQVEFRLEEHHRDVQLQLAIAIGLRRKTEGKIAALIHVLAQSRGDRLIPRIVWQNLHPLLEDHADEFVKAVEDVNVMDVQNIGPIIPRALERLLARRAFDARQISRLLAVVMKDWSPDEASESLQFLASQVQSGQIRGEKLKALQSELFPQLGRAMTLLGDPLAMDAAILAASWHDAVAIRLVKRLVEESKDNAVRVRAFKALVMAAKSDTERLPNEVVGLVDIALMKSGREDTSKVAWDAVPAQLPRPNKEFATRVIASIAELDNPHVADVVLKNYSTIPSDVQPKAIELLTQRAMWARPLVEAIGAGKIPASALNVNQIQRLLALKDKELTAAVNKHWGSIRTTRDPAREQLVTEMRKLIRNTPGDAHRGIEVFNRVCGQCHKIYGQGQDVGPDITGNGRASVEQLLSNVFDPSLVIGAIYQAKTVQAADGRIVTGLLVEDSPQRVVLKTQGGKLETIAREDVEAMKTSELSLMPEGLEKQLKPQEIANLFAFITLDKHPNDPAAKPIPNGGDGKR